MLSKAIHFVGAMIAMGLTWLLVVFLVLSGAFSVQLEGWSLGFVAVGCFALAGYPAWRLFVVREPGSLRR